MKNETERRNGAVPSGIDTETRILRAAADLFAIRGFRASTMRDIAHAAHINEVTVYRYFLAKQDLCSRAVDWKLRDAKVTEALVHTLTKMDSPRELLQAFCSTALRLIAEEPTLPRLVYFTGLELEATERKSIYLNHLKPVVTALIIRLRSWIERREIRKVDPETAAIGVIGILLSQLQVGQLIGPMFSCNRSLESLSSEYTDLCLRGLLSTEISNTAAAADFPQPILHEECK